MTEIEERFFEKVKEVCKEPGKPISLIARTAGNMLWAFVLLPARRLLPAVIPAISQERRAVHLQNEERQTLL